MSVLEVKNITFSYQDELLYDDASMRLFENDHTTLVGPNGSGKTTLLKLLAHEIKPDFGSIDWLPSKRVGYLDQYATIDESMLVKDYIYDVFAPLFEQEKRMEMLYEKSISVDPIQQEKMLNQAATIGDTLLESDFYSIKSKVGDIMHGLGLDTSVLDQTVKTLSGGMRSKIILGKLLLEEADILLLDEPTNFLDVKHIDWLIKFLNNYSKAFLVVSHDEMFLSAIATSVVSLENKKLVRYKGDFKYYKKERILREEKHQKDFHSQQKFIKRTEQFINKNITRATTTKRAQSRRKMLSKLDRVIKPRKETTYKFAFPISRSTGRDVLTVDQLEIGYSDVLVEALNFVIMKEEKVVITGKNGVGKSTFVKTILNELPQISGSYKWIDTAEIAYFEQDSHLDDDLTPFQIVHNTYPHFEKKDVMQLLGSHGIDFDKANRKITTLSGGEKTKVRLALLRHQKGNVLIMDEPTNHLDKAAKSALKDALIDYQGTLILVSHEKTFYQAVCDYEIAFTNEGG